MSVNLIMAATSGGNDIPETNSLGEVALDGSSDTQDIFISHDSDSAITDVELYVMRDTSPDYTGEDPDQDIATLIGWADDNTSDGIQLNMDATSADWLPMNSTAGDVSNPRELITESIVVGTATSDGEIPANAEAKVQVKVKAPSSVSIDAGILGFSLVVAYSATS